MNFNFIGWLKLSTSKTPKKNVRKIYLPIFLNELILFFLKSLESFNRKLYFSIPLQVFKSY